MFKLFSPPTAEAIANKQLVEEKRHLLSLQIQLINLQNAINATQQRLRVFHATLDGTDIDTRTNTRRAGRRATDGQNPT